VVRIEEVRRQRGDPVRHALAQEIPPPAFERWIKPLVHERRDDGVVFTAASSFVANYVERQFGHRIERAIRALFPDIRRVMFVAAPG
jgi:chromosomal replication initiation ATPase DnaA